MVSGRQVCQAAPRRDPGPGYRSEAATQQRSLSRRRTLKRTSDALTRTSDSMRRCACNQVNSQALVRLCLVLPGSDWYSCYTHSKQSSCTNGCRACDIVEPVTTTCARCLTHAALYDRRLVVERIVYIHAAQHILAGESGELHLSIVKCPVPSSPL